MRFHTTMVLTQPEMTKTLLLLLIGFHTTMVLTQRIVILFDYQGIITVSIPLWFLRNRKNSSSTCHLRYRFHTTMVLTQPLLLQKYYTGFQTVESTKWEDLKSHIEFDFHRFYWTSFEMNSLIIDQKAPVFSKKHKLLEIPAKYPSG